MRTAVRLSAAPRCALLTTLNTVPGSNEAATLAALAAQGEKQPKSQGHYRQTGPRCVVGGTNSAQRKRIAAKETAHP